MRVGGSVQLLGGERGEREARAASGGVRRGIQTQPGDAVGGQRQRAQSGSVSALLRPAVGRGELAQRAGEPPDPRGAVTVGIGLQRPGAEPGCAVDVPGQVEAGSIEAGEYLQEPGGNASTAVYRFTVPDGTRLARFDLVAAEQSHDFDLFVVDPEFTGLVALSASGAADERVDLADPEPGEYYVLVNAYSTGEDAKGAFTLRNFAVGETAAGNLTVSPDPIRGVMSQRTTVSLSWSGLNAARPYLGLVNYADSTIPTIVSIG